MRTKKFAALVAVAAIAVGLAGCASAEGDGGGQQKVTWWVPDWNTDTAKALIAEFEKDNPDIKIETATTTWDTMADKIRTALDTGTGPDVIDELTSRISQYAAKDQLLDITDWFDDEMPVDDFYQSAIAAASLDDQIYGVPYRWDAGAMVYNKDIFDELGIEPPTTTAELNEVSQKIVDSGISAFGWPLGNNNNASVRWLNEYYTLGGDFEVADDGSVTIDEDASEQALKNLAAGFEDGFATKSSFESDNTGLQNLLINKQIAFYFDGAYAIEPIKKAGINIGTAMWPGPDGPSTVSADGFSLIVPKSVKNKEATEKFVKFLSLPENQVKLTLTFPGRLSAAEDEKFADPLLQPFLEQQTDYSKSRATFLGWDKLIPTIYAAVQGVCLGQVSAADANKTIVDQAAALGS